MSFFWWIPEKSKGWQAASSSEQSQWFRGTSKQWNREEVEITQSLILLCSKKNWRVELKLWGTLEHALLKKNKLSRRTPEVKRVGAPCILYKYVTPRGTFLPVFSFDLLTAPFCLSPRKNLGNLQMNWRITFSKGKGTRQRSASQAAVRAVGGFSHFYTSGNRRHKGPQTQEAWKWN